MGIDRRILILLLLQTWPWISLCAQESRDTAVPRTRVPVIDAYIAVDGVLDEEAWSRAEIVETMTEVEPDEGAPGTPPTEILLLRNSEFLYVAFVCHEPHPDRMVLRDMHRDALQIEDDAVKILLDTFLDKKSGYYFVISAAGSRLDALVTDNGQRINFEWDGFWEARTRIGSDRWTAEIAIPFKGLSFGEGEIWGLNFERWRGETRTRLRWNGAYRRYRVNTVSEAGELEIQDGIDQGYGIEVLPYCKVRRFREHDPRRAYTRGDFGGEVNWRITHQLTASVTYDTDFAETEADERMVNISRFPLTFPEKRDFFLQDATQFQFGWENAFRGEPVLVPYFSRRIGLSPDGEEIEIEYGARLSGRVENLDIGLLTVHTDERSAENIPSGTLTVARPAYRLTDELTLGGIFTRGNPEHRSDNLVGGVDVRYSSTRTLPGLWNVNAYVMRSDDDEEGELGSAYGFRSTLQTDDWFLSAETLYAQDEFHPAIGFVRRPGERRYTGRVQWEPRPESEVIRKYEFAIDPTLWTEPDGTSTTKDIQFRFFGMEFHSGDELSLDYGYHFDRLDEPFEPVDGSVVRDGEHHWSSLEGEMEFSQTRPLSGRISAEAGGWYNGTRYRYGASGSWNPSPQLELRLAFSENQVKLPGDNDFTTRVETLQINYDFTPDIRIENLIQADNVSDNLGFQSRFRWIQEDNRELFLVVNASWIKEEDDSIVPVEHDITVKVEYAVRF